VTARTAPRSSLCPISMAFPPPPLLGTLFSFFKGGTVFPPGFNLIWLAPPLAPYDLCSHILATDFSLLPAPVNGSNRLRALFSLLSCTALANPPLLFYFTLVLSFPFGKSLGGVPLFSYVFFFSFAFMPFNGALLYLSSFPLSAYQSTRLRMKK